MPRPRRGLATAMEFHEKFGKAIGSDNLRDALCFLGGKAPAANIQLTEKDFKSVRAFLTAHNIPHHFEDVRKIAVQKGLPETFFGAGFRITMASNRGLQQSLKDCEGRMREFLGTGGSIPAELHIEYGTLLGYPTPLGYGYSALTHPASPYAFKSLTKPVRADLERRIAFLKMFPETFSHLENDPKRMLQRAERKYSSGSGTVG